MGWRLAHDELYNRNGQGVIETAAGPIHFERGQGQQGRAWDCSLVLAKYLEQRPEEVRGKRVLELGCGVGLPGVAAAVVGATEVILTDMGYGNADCPTSVTTPVTVKSMGKHHSNRKKEAFLVKIFVKLFVSPLPPSGGTTSLPQQQKNKKKHKIFLFFFFVKLFVSPLPPLGGTASLPTPSSWP
ncbi:conserved unknown protein [Ectocarpus siliculosus]|uniref:Uncharacterized protein n=1 Tax=Ectocarpus siliculosus TaxID=2880 RepID=D8LRE1_ECTSI|nr:conserved unknown protein [Ectocarpus siliculosus]|eukprot:CBN76293.1 conserved unknown protein [Ectocarpus siliculosus]